MSLGCTLAVAITAGKPVSKLRSQIQHLIGLSTGTLVVRAYAQMDSREVSTHWTSGRLSDGVGLQITAG